MHPARLLIPPILVTLTLLAHPGALLAQLRAERVYNGLGRAISVVVSLPDLGRVDTPEAHIRLLEPQTGKVLARTGVASGRTDLSVLFPELWKNPTPRVVYAQLYAGERAVGAALVIQPMLTPDTAVLDPRSTGVPMAMFTRPEGGAVLSGYRVYTDQHVVLETDAGAIRLALRPDVAPNTCWIFRELVAGGLYDGTPFHRVIAADGSGNPFVVQGGDPTGTGTGGPGFFHDLEPSTLEHRFGVVSMARDPRAPNTNGSQFFIALSRAGTKILDGQYTSFAQVIDGEDAVNALAKTPVQGPQSRPKTPPKILRALLVDAPPYGQGPKPVVGADEKPVDR